jgi:uncharacterized protein (TIGR02001 family)
VRNLVRAVCCAAVLASPAAMAGTTGNAGVVSEYLFRGIEQSGGSALQGGIDYSAASGLYAGTWASNTGGPASSGGTEIDFYGGWTGKLGPASVDVGAIYYYFSEDEEDLGLAFDYPEIYAKFGISYFAAQVYYSTSYLGDGNEAAADAAGMDTDFIYLNLLGTFPLSETLSLAVQLGNSSGDGAEVAWGDSYSDYSVALTKTLDNGFAFSFGLYDTTLKIGEGFGTLPAGDDSIKAVVGLKKTFDI